ncbi:MAG: complex I subunit 5 family protein [Candidatus Methanomethylicia archaeon]
MNIDFTLIFALLFSSSTPFLSSNLKTAFKTSIFIMITALLINTYTLFKVFINGVSFTPLQEFSYMLSLIMSEIILIIALASIIFSNSYFNFSEIVRGRIYFGLIPILSATLIGLSMFNNIISMLFFLEASTFISAILVLYGERRDKAVFSTMVYLVMSIIESILILSGIYFLTRGYGLNLALTDINELSKYAIISKYDVELASYCILLGFGIKAGASPIALLWLPLVHSEAPSPISALLSGVIIESAYIPMLKYTYALIPQISINIGGFIAFSGLINVLIGAIGMILDRDLKRILAFSSISSMGGLGMALGLGMIMNIHEAYMCLLGSILYLFAHSFSKALLFLCAGILIKTSHERNWFKMSQKVRFPPITSIMWIIGAISISGLFPFTSGYYGKHIIMESINTIESSVFNISKDVYSFALYFAGIVIFCVLMVFIIFSFKGSEKSKERFDLMFLSSFILMLISFTLGILYSYVYLHDLLHQLFLGG